MENKDYTITRIQKYAKNNGEAKAIGISKLQVLCKDEAGATQDLSYGYEDNMINNVIDLILPQDLADYFLVKGEMIKEINQKNNLKDSVQKIMGLNIIDTAIKHLDPKKTNSVIANFNKEYDVGNNEKAKGERLNVI